MKYLLSLLLFVTTANANMFDGMSKEQLAEYEITIVNKKTGQVVGKMSRAEYKVVKIENPIITQVTSSPAPLKTTQAVSSNSHNSVIFHLGMGRVGMKRGYSSGEYEITQREGLVGGATVCRSENDKGVCFSGFSNSLFTLGLKIDFK